MLIYCKFSSLKIFFKNKSLKSIKIEFNSETFLELIFRSLDIYHKFYLDWTSGTRGRYLTAYPLDKLLNNSVV